MRVPWRSNQSILKEISSGCLLEGLMLKLKLQIFGHLMQRDDSFEKTLMLGKGTTEDELVGWTLSLPRVWVNSGSWWWTGRPGVLQFMGSKRVSQTRLSDWTELNVLFHLAYVFQVSSMSSRYTFIPKVIPAKFCWVFAFFPEAVS